MQCVLERFEREKYDRIGRGPDAVLEDIASSFSASWIQATQDEVVLASWFDVGNSSGPLHWYLLCSFNLTNVELTKKRIFVSMSFIRPFLSDLSSPLLEMSRYDSGLPRPVGYKSFCRRLAEVKMSMLLGLLLLVLSVPLLINYYIFGVSEHSSRT